MAFRANLFPQVQLSIGFENFTTVVRSPDQGNAAVPEHILQDEIGAKFLRNQRVHGLTICPPGQQVCARGFEFSCTGAEQGKAQAAFLYQSMHLIQQRRNALYLIDDNPITL